MKLKVWNLKMTEKELRKEGKNEMAWAIRQILDDLSPNWRIVRKPKTLITNKIEKI